MLASVLCGLVLGLGLWCLLRAFHPPSVPLDRALAAIAQPRLGPPGPPGGMSVDGVTGRLGAWIMDVTGTDLSALAADLAVLERSREHHLVQRMRTAFLYGSFPFMVWLFTYLGAGISPAHPAFVTMAALVAAVAGWFATDAQVRARARRRRQELDSALVSYVSLVGVLLAGGAGIQQSLHDAVDTGRGWPFLVLRRALTDARIRGISPWQAFDEHGTRLGLVSLVDLAAIEREAAGRTSAMVGPTGFMLAGFVILLIYPAFQAILEL
jgi:tight adherence protein C